jgi:hypothetical protein
LVLLFLFFYFLVLLFVLPYSSNWYPSFTLCRCGKIKGFFKFQFEFSI